MGKVLKDRVALVTGSGHGIGRAVAIALAAEGAKVVTNNRKPGGKINEIIPQDEYDKLDGATKKKLDEEYENFSGDAEKTANRIKSLGGEAAPCYADISKFDDAKKLVDFTVSTYGKIDIIVNVAGILARGSVDEITEEEWDICLNTKPKGHFNVIHFAAPYMIKQGYGRIVNCASGAFMGNLFYDAPHYCASNAGVVGLTRAVAGELFTNGITCNAFCPHAQTRPRMDDIAPKQDEGRPIFPAAPDSSTETPFIVFLCSEASANVSGTVFFLNDNLIARHREPIPVRTMIKPMDKGAWTVEEIDKVVDAQLLNGYHSIVGKIK
ncbi:MAG: SDR family oxidoreductase [Peptococcaceae bacterium]|jgi:3-oxoacyl-[acyl-carrier protein] reductase|nr:SDR family oxidoreductase [Peptococcaceae bacterium]